MLVLVGLALNAGILDSILCSCLSRGNISSLQMLIDASMIFKIQISENIIGLHKWYRCLHSSKICLPNGL